MKRSSVTVMIFTARICGLGAACTGLLPLLGSNIPLPVHLVFGGLLAAILGVFAYMARALARGPAFGAAALAVAIPFLGLLELRSSLGGFQWTLLWLHPAVGIGGIGLAEILAKRIRLGQKK